MTSCLPRRGRKSAMSDSWWACEEELRHQCLLFLEKVMSQERLPEKALEHKSGKIADLDWEEQTWKWG